MNSFRPMTPQDRTTHQDEEEVVALNNPAMLLRSTCSNCNLRESCLPTGLTLKEIERQNQERIDAMESRIAELEAQPAQRWEKAVTVAITGVVGAVVGMALAAAGMG